jgi:hypothetical protein
MLFSELPTTKKGDIGEAIIKRILSGWNWQYKPAPPCAHVIDFEAVTDKGEALAVEVKTYPRRAYTNDTGIDAADFETYTGLDTDVLLIFVDQFERCIYGERLSRLSAFAQYDGAKVYFPLHLFRVVRKLKPSELKQLNKYPISPIYRRTARFFSGD